LPKKISAFGSKILSVVLFPRSITRIVEVNSFIFSGRIKHSYAPLFMKFFSAALLFLLFATFSMEISRAQERDFGMGPPTTPAIVAAANAAVAKPMAPGPFQPTWDSVRENYQTPKWFQEAKFGLFMHWGLYSVPAYHNEWYEKHMYAAFAQWHAEHFGAQDKFGYKDFIPLFTCEKFNADEWADLFKKSGAKYVVPTAEHHDNFAMWDSDVTPFNAKKMGPHRDLIGELSVAVRKKGLKFGVSNHGMENFTFINPTPELDAKLKAEHADLYDTNWADFYHVADRSDAACQKFLTDWVNRNEELIDKYQPDMLWFDNGVNHRYYDPLKLTVAAYYYNRAKSWGKEVSISTKDSAYAPGHDDSQQIGSIIDFEKIGARSPGEIRPGPWQVDDPIGTTWGYTSDMRVQGPGAIIHKLADTVSRNGNLLLNLSPKSDGTIPDEQKKTLLAIGAWLEVNGDAIYGTHNWTRFSEGNDARGGNSRELGWRFTVKDNFLYAIALAWPTNETLITSLAMTNSVEKITRVELLGHAGDLEFSQDQNGLKIKLPAEKPCDYAYSFKISGLKLK
jgi:alpha-L-fucosidase